MPNSLISLSCEPLNSFFTISSTCFLITIDVGVMEFGDLISIAVEKKFVSSEVGGKILATPTEDSFFL
jgi:hypothetical protein